MYLIAMYFPPSIGQIFEPQDFSTLVFEYTIFFFSAGDLLYVYQTPNLAYVSLLT